MASTPSEASIEFGYVTGVAESKDELFSEDINALGWNIPTTLVQFGGSDVFCKRIISLSHISVLIVTMQTRRLRNTLNSAVN